MFPPTSTDVVAHSSRQRSQQVRAVGNLGGCFLGVGKEPCGQSRFFALRNKRKRGEHLSGRRIVAALFIFPAAAADE